MTADEFAARVEAELAFLSGGGEPQELLRRVYREARLRAMGRHGEGGPSPDAVLASARASVRRLYPDAALAAADGFPG